MRDHGDVLAFSPRLPAQLTRLTFRLVYRGRRIRVDIGADCARYELLAGEQLELLHHGEPITLVTASPQTHACPALPDCPPVEPPPGRAAGKRGIGADATSARMTPPPRQ
jgi:alpha,alpha-trehalose phosphorylase